MENRWVIAHHPNSTAWHHGLSFHLVCWQTKGEQHVVRSWSWGVSNHSLKSLFWVVMVNKRHQELAIIFSHILFWRNGDKHKFFSVMVRNIEIRARKDTQPGSAFSLSLSPPPHCWLSAYGLTNLSLTVIILWCTFWCCFKLDLRT